MTVWTKGPLTRTASCGVFFPENAYRVFEPSSHPRPCAAVTDLLQGSAIDRHLQFFGFDKESVHAFVMKYLGKVQGKKMLSQLAESPSMSSLMHTPFFALLMCEQFKEVGELPQRRTDIFSSVTLRVVQRFAQREGMKPARFKSVEKAPRKLFEAVLEVGKVAFDRLKEKDLSYFELKDGELSEEAVGLGFLEHVQAMSLSEEDQYGFRHLTVQEYLAALYASKQVLKKAGDVAKLAEELGCGEEAGHLNTFWVFVAGLVDENLREELFCAIAETDMQTVAKSVEDTERIVGVAGAGEAIGGTDGASATDEPEETNGERLTDVQSSSERLSRYRYLLLLHCFVEATAGSVGKPSACVGYVLKRQGIVVCTSAGLVLSHSDLRVMSTVMQCHDDAVERVDVEGVSLRR